MEKYKFIQDTYKKYKISNNGNILSIINEN